MHDARLVSAVHFPRSAEQEGFLISRDELYMSRLLTPNVKPNSQHLFLNVAGLNLESYY